MEKIERVSLEQVLMYVNKILPFPEDILMDEIFLTAPPFYILCDFYQIPLIVEGSYTNELLPDNQFNLEKIYADIFMGREITEGEAFLFPVYDREQRNWFGIKCNAVYLKQLLLEDYYKFFGRNRFFDFSEITTYFLFPQQKQLFLYEEPGYIYHINAQNVIPKPGKAYPLKVNQKIYDYHHTLIAGKAKVWISSLNEHRKQVNQILGDVVGIYEISEYGIRSNSIVIENIAMRDADNIKQVLRDIPVIIKIAG